MSSQLVGDDQGLSTFQAALDALSLYAQRYLEVEIVGARPDEQYWSDGNLHEVVDVTFRIFGRPGLFTVYPEYRPKWVQHAEERIALRRDEVNAIYEGVASVSEISGYVPAAVTPIGPAVAV